MRYCVIKDTIKVIDGSENPIEIMLQNAQNAGFAEIEVEILTEEEYEERKSQEPVPIPTPSFSMEDYILDLEFRLSILEMGGI